MRLRTLPALALGLLLCACGGGGGGGGAGDGGGGGTSAAPPGQPPSGPGGASYAFASVLETSLGAGSDQVWVFEPDQGAGPSSPRPLVVFLHGWSVLSPDPYRAWIEHLVRRGAIVVYPRYQESTLTPPGAFTANAVGAVRTALAWLDARGGATADAARAAVAGHSFGGVLAANLAAVAAAEGLPWFRAVLCAEPGTGGFPVHADYGDIPAGTLLLTVAGEDDATVGTTDAIRIFREATALPADDKDYVLLLTDRHGTPPLVADHEAPASHPTLLAPDAYDWRGFWKWFDGLCDAAWSGTNRAYALGDTPEQRDMGAWSDGVPVLEPVVGDP